MSDKDEDKLWRLTMIDNDRMLLSMFYCIRCTLKNYYIYNNNNNNNNNNIYIYINVFNNYYIYT